MRGATLFSGIGAPEIAAPEIEWVWHAEIDAFPSAVMAHHHGTPNLGDVSADDFIERAKQHGPIDILVAGSPCQSFSVAGKRLGLDDPRGNLALVTLGIVNKLRPAHFVFENVPGLLSSGGGDDLAAFFDELSAAGYLADLNIFDAQEFGLAQRRRRVFVWAQSVETILKMKTNTSRLITAKFLTQALLSTLGDTLSRCESAPASWDYQGPDVSFFQSMIKSFEMHTKKDTDLKTLLRDLASAGPQSPKTQQDLELTNGASQASSTAGGLSLGLMADAQSTLTDTSWSSILGDDCGLTRLFITSTATSKITTFQIYTCLKASVSIAALIPSWRDLSQNWSDVAWFFLTVTKDVMNYARQASSELFDDEVSFSDWDALSSLAEQAGEVIEHFGDWRPPAAVLFEPESLRWDTPPSRQAREETARDAGSGVVGDRGCYWNGGQVTQTLDAVLHKGQTMPEKNRFPAVLQDAQALNLRGREGGAMPETSDVASLRAASGGSSRSMVVHGAQDPITNETTAYALGRNHGQENAVFSITGHAEYKDEKPTLRAHGGDIGGGSEALATYSVDENRNGHKEVFGTLQARREGGGFEGAVAFSSKDYGADAALEVSPTLRAGGHDASHANGGVPPAVAGSHWDDASNPHPTLTTSKTSGGIAMSNQEIFSQRGGGLAPHLTVRRLTPRECEKLQGFPPDFTLIPYRHGKPAADGPRYKALGNSMAVPVIGWVLDRVQMFSELRPTALRAHAPTDRYDA